eukprot:gb/GEZN01014164.1/.p1 GENE.gb/GEZN01014164.1/~~gb/GEZN01014164.1/.p1  ORF type:complete len:107 (+),score=4.63 gb/GEZN01014164.1/:26-346(+)
MHPSPPFLLRSITEYFRDFLSLRSFLKLFLKPSFTMGKNGIACSYFDWNRTLCAEQATAQAKALTDAYRLDHRGSYYIEAEIMQRMNRGHLQSCNQAVIICNHYGG